MTGKSNRLHMYILALAGAAVSIASIGGAGYAYSSASPSDDHAVCELQVETANGTFALQAIYNAEFATQGRYQFSVKSVGGSGNTNINQGGGFSARAKESVVLGQMNLSGANAYDISLMIDANGRTEECKGRVGSS